MTAADPPPWSGSLALLPGAVVYDGPGGPAGWHAHHALQVMVSDGAAFTLTTQDAHGERATHHGVAAIVPSGVAHRLEATPDRMVLLLVEPVGTRGRDVGAGPASLRSGTEDFRDRMLVRGASAASLLETTLGVVATGGEAGARELSEPVRTAMGYLEAHAADPSSSLAGAAAVAHLSPTRLTHRFTAEVGMPFRRYALWVRLRRAVEAVASGEANLTDAAVAAGFSDGAHLSRAFRRNFGLAPSALSRMRIAEAEWPGRVTPG